MHITQWEGTYFNSSDEDRKALSKKEEKFRNSEALKIVTSTR